MIFLFCVAYYDRTQAHYSNLLFCRIVFAKTGSHFSHNALKNGQSPHLGLWPGIAEFTP